MDATSDRFSQFSQFVTSMDDVRGVIGHPKPQIVAKVIDHVSDICKEFIERSSFLLIASSNAQGRCEVSPKGDPMGFVHVLDEKHLAIPDRPGNRLAGTFSNLVENPHLGLIFLIPGKNETLRIGGEARIVRDEHIRNKMAVDGKVPELAIVVDVEHAEIHCPKCMIRSKPLQPEGWPDNTTLPTISEATSKHANLDMSVEALDSLAEQDGWTTLY